MSEKFKTNCKKFFAGGGLYIALALCILAIISIAVYSAIRSVLTTPDQGDLNSNDPLAPSGKDDDKDDGKPTDGNPLDDDDDSLDTGVPVKVMYSYPLTGQVTKDFSDETLVFSVTMNDYRTHAALDIGATIGTAVKAAADGMITAVYADPLMGQTIEITHADGIISKYQNLASLLPQTVELGATVTRGDVIGGVGETALVECAEEPHLHLEFISDGEKVNPKNHIG